MEPPSQQPLADETECLARSWNRHDASWLRDYLVAGVEDPRINVQSVLTRHFLVEHLRPEMFGELMHEEYQFAAAINCLLPMLRAIGNREDCDAVLHALRHGSDNAEGIEIPPFILETFAALAADCGTTPVPNYIESCFAGARFENGLAIVPDASLNPFRDRWSSAIAPRPAVGSEDQRTPLSVIEAACGSANDYRFLEAYGIARFLDYAGFDLSEKNIANARALFPSARFEVGNAFQITAPDKSFDVGFAHDLFEHLSLEGMQIAVRELCRVTRRGLCVGFFSMDEMADHQVRQVDEYHWNTLAMARMKSLFAEHGFAAQVIHVGTFLQHEVGCDYTHNPNAYTFLLRAVETPAVVNSSDDLP